MAKELIKLEQSNWGAFDDLALEFEAFASDVFKQLASMSDAELRNAGVECISKDGHYIKFIFSHGDVTYELEKRKANTSDWQDEVYIGRYYSKSWEDFSFELSRKLVCSQTVQEGTSYSTKQHFNNSFRVKDEKKDRETLMVRVSSLHCIEGNVDDFRFVLNNGESEMENRTLKSLLPEDEIHGFTSYNSFPVAYSIGCTSLENMRAGWEIVYKKLGLVPRPYGKTRDKN